MRNEVVLKINWLRLCENAWFPWQPVMLFSRKGVGRPTKSIISQLLLILDNKTWYQLKDRHMPFIPWSDLEIISFAY